MRGDIVSAQWLYSKPFGAFEPYINVDPHVSVENGGIIRCNITKVSFFLGFLSESEPRFLSASFLHSAVCEAVLQEQLFAKTPRSLQGVNRYQASDR